MEFLKDRRVVLGLGALIAIVLGALIAVAIAGGSKKPDGPPPASQGGLVVEQGRDDDTKLDPARPIRCFVEGQFAGEVTLTECARRNGVATGALDVGVDETGALSASGQTGAIVAPLPPTEVQTAPPHPAPAPAPQPQGPASTPPTPAATPVVDGGACWRYADATWSKVADGLSLNACVQRLYAGQCERSGRASYGRWGQQTLRLVPGKVEISDDNRRFRTLARQNRKCVIEPVT
ncbi:MAG: hypothetical protein GC145_11650 [Caulobacter sp.]|nr:hypothetical protein [Caulobacter sp.]